MDRARTGRGLKTAWLFQPRPAGLSRRQCLTQGGALIAGAAVLAGPVGARASSQVADVTSFGALSGADNSAVTTAAFQAAVASLVPGGGGTLYVPPGQFYLTAPINIAAPITVRGDGKSLSILAINHPETGLNITAVYAGGAASYGGVEIEGIGFTPIGTPEGAISIVAAGVNDSGWQTCRIENVDFSAPLPNGNAFGTALYLKNVWRSVVRNVNLNASGNGSTYFVNMDGLCVDNQFISCHVNQAQVGFAVSAYNEGLHIEDCVVVNCSTAIDTGAGPASAYRGSINLLGLYVTGCELACNLSAMSLQQVNSAYITATHFYTANPAAVVCLLQGCQYVQINGCHISGQYDTNQTNTTSLGIGISSTTTAVGQDNQIDDCLFTNVLTGLKFGPGVSDNTATKMRMTDPGGNTSLLAGSAVLSNGKIASVVVDSSGTGTNLAEWVTQLPGSARFGYSH